MGEVQVTFGLASMVQPERVVEITALADSGATYTVIPSTILSNAGVQPTTMTTVRYADGRTAARRLGAVWISIDGRRTPALVMFGESGDVPLLGVTVLELLGLGIDPVNKRLIPVEAHLYLEYAQPTCWEPPKTAPLSKYPRRKTRKVMIGGVGVGGDDPIRVQTMCTTDTRDVKATVAQIKQVEEVGCEIVRVAAPDMEAAQALGAIKKQIRIPLVADIHFDYRLALEAARQGVDKIRINPGNIGKPEFTAAVVKACKERGIPIRIGVNAGSLKVVRAADHWLDFSEEEWAGHMMSDALDELKILQDHDFHEVIISMKSDAVDRVILAYRMISEKCDYPLHLGVTEAGTLLPGLAKSAIAFGALLRDGIGDTIRVSLTEDPVLQVKAGFEILKAIGLRAYGPNIIACPTCGRCEVDLFDIVRKFEGALNARADLKQKAEGMKIAIMGCVVNGPGESRDADIGISGGKGVGVLIKRGQVIRNVPEPLWVPTLLKEIELWEPAARSV